MKGNRRNYYRVLHVQPEAPPDVIRASYRTMMTKLRHHPDKGGDHDSAVLINEAYAVLNNPDRRRHYDRDLHREHLRDPATQRAAPAPVAPGVAFLPARPPVPRAAQGSCLFCRTAVPAMIEADTRCRRCDSPLAPPPARPAGGDELAGRRALPRVSKSDPVMICQGWQRRAYGARLRDLSLSGISVLMDEALQVNQVIRVVAPAFDVLACVVTCRASDGLFAVHARLLAAIFPERTGVFVSTKV